MVIIGADIRLDIVTMSGGGISIIILGCGGGGAGESANVGS